MESGLSRVGKVILIFHVSGFGLWMGRALSNLDLAQRGLSLVVFGLFHHIVCDEFQKISVQASICLSEHPRGTEFGFELLL